MEEGTSSQTESETSHLNTSSTAFKIRQRTEPMNQVGRHLLLVTLEKLKTDELKSFQSLLTTGLPGYPPIPEIQLENADRRHTVGQMMQRYGPGGAKMITLKILRRMKRNDLVEEMRIRGLLVTTLEKLDTDSEEGKRQWSKRRSISLQHYSTHQLKRFQSHLTTGLPGYPPIPEIQLDYADSQDTVDQMMQRYDSDRSVNITLEILRKMKRKDLAEELQKNLNRENLLLTTLKELNTDELKSFQSHLTTGLRGYPPIPEIQLENADSQDTVDQMMQRYSPVGAEMITLKILRRMKRKDLAEQIRRRDRRGEYSAIEFPSRMNEPPFVDTGKKERTDLVGSSTRTSDMEIPSSEDPGIQTEDTLDTKTHISEVLLGAPVSLECNQITHLTSTEVDPSVTLRHHFRDPARPLPRPHSWPSFIHRSRGERRQDHVRRDLSQSCPDLLIPVLLVNFTPQLIVNENRRTYRFQCPHAGVFQCSVTGLVFGMEGEGEVLYRTVTWDRKLLAHSGKRPAGPLFDIDCPQMSIYQLHLPHCHSHLGGCDILSVAHVTDDSWEFIPPTKITDTHVIINISGCSAYGNTEDENAPLSPRNTLVLLFYQPPLVNQERSILKVLLLPSNVVVKEVQHERRKINGDKEKYIESGSHCQLTPNKEYNLSTDPPDKHRITPKKAKFVTFDSYQNYIPTFRLLFQTTVDEVNLLLKENDDFKTVWEDLVWIPAWTTEPHPPDSVGQAPSGFPCLLLKTLDELVEAEMKRFQWHLYQDGDEFEPFAKSVLEKASRQETVDLMVAKFSRKSVYVTLKILRKMNQNALAEKLERKFWSL